MCRERNLDRGARAAVQGAALAAALLTVPEAGAQVAFNSCAHPYWADSLRCAVFPSRKPQPNFGTAPANPAEIRDFTRVFLNRSPAVRCLDGTRPVIYVSKAVCTNPAGCGGVPFGGPVDSDKWIISMTGGGSCHARDSTGSGVFDDAQECLDTYLDPAEIKEMGTAQEPAMKTLSGINRPDPVRNPVFAGYNRVLVEKCSYDRYNGRVAYQAAGGYFHETGPGGVVLDFNMYQQGYLIILEALRALRNGLNYTTWADDGAGGVATLNESLPPLSAAESVLFVGHSGAAHGLYHNIDALAGALALLPGFAGDVRAVFDANFTESIENEAAFVLDGNGNPIGDAYDDVWAGQTTGDGVNFSYDGAVYNTTGEIAQAFASWASAPDDSCLSTHTATDGQTWKCLDRQHVLFNHISTPFLFREDFSDPNKEHTLNNTGHLVQWADQAFWSNYAHCPTTDPCPPRFRYPDEHRARLEKQAQTLLSGALIRSELATGTDPSLAGAGVFPTFQAWMPDCGSHGGAFNDAAFYETTMSYLGFTYSMRTWLESFLTLPRTDLLGWYIDGWTDSGGNAMTSGCPGP